MNRRIKNKRQKRLKGCSYSETRKWIRIMEPIFRKYFEYCVNHHISNNYLVQDINDDLIRADVPFRVYTDPWDIDGHFIIIPRQKISNTMTKLETDYSMNDVIYEHDSLHEEEDDV